MGNIARFNLESGQVCMNIKFIKLCGFYEFGKEVENERIWGSAGVASG